MLSELMSIFRKLPKDLVEEILCFVPATNLKRLGSTCKRWNHLFTGDKRFARKHTEKAAKQFLVLMLTRGYRICPMMVNLHGFVPSIEVKSELSLVDTQFDISQVFHCDGLLLCTSEYESRFVVWNPFTGETRWFQPPIGRKGYHGLFVLGYCNNKRYKILSFDVVKKNYEIYELSSDSWRTLDDIMAPGWSIGYSYTSMSLKGNAFCFAKDGTKTQEILSLLKFDFTTEKTVPVPLPYQSETFEVSLLSVVRDEKLSVLLQRHVSSKTEIWVTNKIDVDLSWSKILELNLSPDLQIWHDGSFLLDEDKKVVTICERWLDMEDVTETKSRDMIYIVGEDSQVTQFVLGVDIPVGCTQTILSYVPSLVQIERAGNKRKICHL